jgi:Na+/melibiose symporter-like transporter
MKMCTRGRKNRIKTQQANICVTVATSFYHTVVATHAACVATITPDRNEEKELCSIVALAVNYIALSGGGEITVPVSLQ